jgi:hypothetical protein
MSSNIEDIMATEALISAVSQALVLGGALQRNPHTASVHRKVEAVLAEIDQAAQEDPTSPLPMPLVVGLEQLLLGGAEEVLFAVRVISTLLAYERRPGDCLGELRRGQVRTHPFKRCVSCMRRWHSRTHSRHLHHPPAATPICPCSCPVVHVNLSH